MFKVRRQLQPFAGLDMLPSLLRYSLIKQPLWMHTDYVCHVILDINIYSMHHTVESIPPVSFNTIAEAEIDLLCTAKKRSHELKKTIDKTPSVVSLFLHLILVTWLPLCAGVSSVTPIYTLLLYLSEAFHPSRHHILILPAPLLYARRATLLLHPLPPIVFSLQYHQQAHADVPNYSLCSPHPGKC